MRGSYAPAGEVPAIRAGLAAAELGDALRQIGPVEGLDDVDWSEAWKVGLEAVRSYRRACS